MASVERLNGRQPKRKKLPTQVFWAARSRYLYKLNNYTRKAVHDQKR